MRLHVPSPHLVQRGEGARTDSLRSLGASAVALEGERPTFLDQEEPGRDSVALGLGAEQVRLADEGSQPAADPPHRSGSGGNKDSQCRRALQSPSA